ncbi:MAG: hypothetical protein Q8O22_04805 [Candidatus Omnitrophota bacterium]|nr:hypothetical protein [Candidatus Omnitrophota bacterium]
MLSEKAVEKKQYWCFNFANDKQLLHYGLAKNLWLCQYVYRDTYLNDATVTRNWRKFKEIKVGDTCLAYLPNSRFYAAGEIIPPWGPAVLRDNIDDIIKGKQHHKNGIIHYNDSAMFEDYIDTTLFKGENDNLSWRRAQRVAVKWQYIVMDGVYIPGLANACMVTNAYRFCGAFQIKSDFFKEVKDILMGNSGDAPLNRIR